MEKKTQVLVVEDEIIIAKDIQNRLRNLGYEVPTIAISGEEALKKINEIKPDLILMDIRLKGNLDGIETAKQISSKLKIPVIYLTAYADNNTLHRAKLTEPYGYIFKPFEDREIYTAIEVALHKYKIELKQRESERRFATTLKCIGDAVITLAQDKTITFMNPVAENLTGWTSQEALGKDISAVFCLTENSIPQNLEATLFNETANQNPKLADYYHLKTRQENYLAIDFSVASIKDEDQATTGFVLSFSDKSLRQKTEEALLHSEEKLRSIMENAPDFIISMDRDGIIQFINQTIPQYTTEEVLTTTIFDYISPKYHQIVQEKLKRVFETGEQCSYEIEGVGVHNPSWYSTIIGPIKNKEKVISAIAISRDITERKQMETALRESERKGKAILDALPDIMFRLNAEGLILDFKATDIGELYVEPYEVIGSNMFDSLPPEESKKFRHFVQKAITTKEIQLLEYQLQVKNGPQDFEARIVMSGEDEIVIIVRNISTRKQAEKQIQKRLQIEEAIAKISRLFVSPQEANLEEVLKNLGEAFDVNRAFIFQLRNLGTIVENTFEWVAPNTTAYKNLLQNISVSQTPWWMKQLKEEQKVVISNIDLLPAEAQQEKELFQLQKTQSLLAIPIQCEKSKLIGFMGISDPLKNRPWPEEDIQALRVISEMVGNYLERQRAQKERKQLEAQMQHAQKLESLGILAGGIAHDFNNLLMGILGNASLALMDLTSETPVQYSIQQIETAALRAAELVNQLLAYSGKGKFEVQAVDLSKLVEEMMHLLRTAISGKVVLKTDFCPDIPKIKVDPSQLRQVVMNIITNASDAIGEESGIIHIETGVIEATTEYLSQTYLNDQHKEGYYVYLEVKDTGSGMDQTTIAKIFDPFFTTKFTGRGLGLASVLGIVRGHSGSLKVTSQPKTGTTFRVLFPVPELSELPLESETKNGEQEWKGEGVVLVVDDEETVRTIAKMILERFGFTVLIAKNGIEAIDIFQRNKEQIKFVLLDLTMPQMNGKEVFLELQQITPVVKVILSSGHSEQDINDLFQDLPKPEFIQKPYRPQQLVQKIRQVLKI